MNYSIYDICRNAFPADNPDWLEPYLHIEGWNDDRMAFEFFEEMWAIGNLLFGFIRYRRITKGGRASDWSIVPPPHSTQILISD